MAPYCHFWMKPRNLTACGVGWKKSTANLVGIAQIKSESCSNHAFAQIRGISYIIRWEYFLRVIFFRSGSGWDYSCLMYYFFFTSYLFTISLFMETINWFTFTVLCLSSEISYSFVQRIVARCVFYLSEKHFTISSSHSFMIALFFIYNIVLSVK